MPHPLLVVADVRASSRFYHRLLDRPADTDQSHPHRQEYDRVVDANGAVLLELHRQGAEHGNPIDDWLAQPLPEVRGAGVVLHFEVRDLAAAEGRLRELGTESIGGSCNYPDGSSRLLLRDPDGYAVALFQAGGR
ncbi:MAG TPA: VOC family protein [Chloroflexota bacterium]|jgi:catechol 2,3-dioxygenase-like lactoylglutathione lyase family enzyme|nr:VOC family protein [Chloroflexota bacterium]